MARHTPPASPGVPEQRLRALSRPSDADVSREASPEDVSGPTAPPPPYAADVPPAGDDGVPTSGDASEPPPLPPRVSRPPRSPHADGDAPASDEDAPTPSNPGTGAPAPASRTPDDDPPPGYVEVFPGAPATDRRRVPLLGALLDRLPARALNDRPALGRSGISALAAVCLVAAGATGWFVLAARPDSAPAPPQHAASPPDTAPSASTSPTGTVVVHVGGEVESPGVVTLPAGARVADAVEAAGGLRPDADPGLLNLARPLVDGEQVLVGVTPSPAAGQAAPGTPGGGRIDLNTATAEQLQTLPGVGPVLARRIVDHRASTGGFTSVEQLLDVTGIGERRFADLRDLVHVGGAP